MSKVPSTFILITLIAVICLPLMTAKAIQPGVPGFAEISDPVPNQRLSGLITVHGTAFHPDFNAYELFFSYDPNPTDTWFPLTEPIDTPVQEAGLALWDTTALTPGTYQLRLQVTSNQGQSIEAIVSGLQLGAGAPEPADEQAQPEPVDPSELPAASGPAGSDPVESVEVDDIQPLSPQETLLRLLLSGAAAAAALLLGFGGYTILRPRVREYLGLLRMRRMAREQRRSDRDRPSRQ